MVEFNVSCRVNELRSFVVIMKKLSVQLSNSMNKDQLALTNFDVNSFLKIKNQLVQQAGEYDKFRKHEDFDML